MNRKLTKEQVETLNSVALTNFEKAKSMLDGINLVLGTNYNWFAMRVVAVVGNPNDPCTCVIYDAESYAG